MEFENIVFKKTLKDADGHLFQVDWNTPQGRCPTCGLLVSAPIIDINYFTFSYQSINNVGISQEILIKTPVAPSLTNVYMIFNVYTDPGSTVKLYENPTVKGNGSLLTGYNTDRNNPTIASESELYLSPLVSSYGTNIYTKTQGSSIAPKTFTDMIDNYRLVLKRDTTYIIKTTPIVNNTTVSANILWYEVK